MLPENKSKTVIVREGMERACVTFSSRVAHLGFSRTRKAFWTRERVDTVDLIHFHRHGISYGSPLDHSCGIRVHFGIRVLNDSFEAPPLNGPCSTDPHYHGARYHHSFNAKSWSQFDRCVDDLVRFLVERGEPWFARYADPTALLVDGGPLSQDARSALRLALAGSTNPDSLALSRKLLGLARNRP